MSGQSAGFREPRQGTTDTSPEIPGKASATEAAYDLIVLGAGVGGMTAALVAAIEGLRVLLIEKSGQVGGTSARSSGTV